MTDHLGQSGSSADAVATPYVIHEEFDPETLETEVEIGWEWNRCPDCGREGGHTSNSGRGGIRCG